MRKKLIIALSAAGIVAATAGSAIAAESIVIPAQHWSFGGLFGTYDRGALVRGLQVYRTICQGCHSLKLVAFRNLRAIGLTEDQVKKIATEYDVTDGPNDQGEMYKRTGRPADYFVPPFPNDKAARAANNGALPPDLSVIIKARDGGADYVYDLLTGFRDPPPGVKLGDGMNYNAYFPGHQIAMPPPLAEGAVDYADKTKATVPQMARDVTTFLVWAAEPELEARKRIGVKVLLFLLVLTGMFYAVKRKIWSDVH